MLGVVLTFKQHQVKCYVERVEVIVMSVRLTMALCDLGEDTGGDPFLTERSRNIKGYIN